MELYCNIAVWGRGGVVVVLPASFCETSVERLRLSLSPNQTINSGRKEDTSTAPSWKSTDSMACWSGGYSRAVTLYVVVIRTVVGAPDQEYIQHSSSTMCVDCGPQVRHARIHEHASVQTQSGVWRGVIFCAFARRSESLEVLGTFSTVVTPADCTNTWAARDGVQRTTPWRSYGLMYDSKQRNRVLHGV